MVAVLDYLPWGLFCIAMCLCNLLSMNAFMTIFNRAKKSQKGKVYLFINGAYVMISVLNIYAWIKLGSGIAWH